MTFALVLLAITYVICAHTLMQKLIAAKAYETPEPYKYWKLFVRPVSYFCERLPRK